MDVAYLEEKLQLVGGQVQDTMSLVNMSLRIRKPKWNSFFNRRKEKRNTNIEDNWLN